MSAITIHLSLTYTSQKQARLVFEAFSQWPTNTVRKKVPNAARLQSIKTSMEYMGYQLPRIYKLVFDEQSCQLETPPTFSQHNSVYKVSLEFYCGKTKGYELWDALFSELTALPVTINGSLYADFDGSEFTKQVVVA